MLVEGVGDDVFHGYFEGADPTGDLAVGALEQVLGEVFVGD